LRLAFDDDVKTSCSDIRRARRIVVCPGLGAEVMPPSPFPAAPLSDSLRLQPAIFQNDRETDGNIFNPALDRS
jgi:hypothetical protein